MLIQITAVCNSELVNGLSRGKKELLLPPCSALMSESPFQKFKFAKRETNTSPRSLEIEPGVEGKSSLAEVVAPNETPKRRKLSGKVEVFEEGQGGLPERLGNSPLRMIIVGTNPSGHAWKSGHYYSNPNNNMWKILRQTGIAPPHVAGAQDDYRLPADAGVGFLDVGCGVPGTHLSKFSSSAMQGWSTGFYQRMADHMHRASSAIGCTCGRCGAPSMVCFAGKRQWMELLNLGKKGKEKLTRVDGGKQTTIRPAGWPFPSTTEVWVLPSTSGAAPMTVEERVSPYREVAEVLARIPWPREINCSCC